MTRLISCLILIFIISSCSRLEKTKSLFADSIEISFDDSWKEKGSININKDGLANISRYKITDSIDEKTCYRMTIGKVTIDSINYYLSYIKKEKIDSVYDYNCKDCGDFNIKIKSSDTLIKTLIFGMYESNDRISKFARYISTIQPNPEDRVDSCFEFTTLKYLLPPPPLEQVHKFIPPNDTIFKTIE
jgi:hypothetical protein